MRKKHLPILIAVFLMLTFSSCTCIYFNTFYNIRKNFNTAEKNRKKAGRDEAGGGEVRQYTEAIAKASKVLERHPTSSWVDDALYIVGTSYYYLGDYSKSTRKFKELFANYPQSEYIPRARVLMAKAKLKMEEEAEAVVLFEEIFTQDTDKQRKADAARSLGEYYFEAKEYETANIYFQSLIDSLGEDIDKLRAMMYIADGYFDLYAFSKALDSYEKALDFGPDSLQRYRIEFRMAECDYFLNDIASGLRRLSKLADNELYYDSLAPIRLKMAEGYEWEGDLESAINTYEQVTIEKPGLEPAAVAYFSLGLIYQYDLGDLDRARAFFEKARDERRKSSVSEEATRRASKLALLEQYSKSEVQSAATDSAGTIDPATLNSLTKNQFLLGELFYMDLEKPDSALEAFRVLLDKYPDSRYAPQALISMAHIYKNESADTAAADSLLRAVLKRYPRSDEAETAIGMLGLAGTVADTGYAKLTYVKAEFFLDDFIALDSTRYYLSLSADSLLAADSIRRAQDSAAAADSAAVPDSPEVTPGPPVADAMQMEDMVLGTDSIMAAALAWKDSIRVADSMRMVHRERYADSVMEANMRRVADSMRIADSLRVADSIAAAELIHLADSLRSTVGAARGDTGRPPDSMIRLVETLRGDPVLGGDSVSMTDAPAAIDTLAPADTLGSMDTLPVTEVPIVPDMPMPPDSAAVPETMAGLDSLFAFDSLAAADSLVKVDTGAPGHLEPAADSAAAPDTVTAPPAPQIDYWQVAFDQARERYKPRQMELLDSARYYYNYVIDSFPFSDYSIQARYVLLWIYDRYLDPGDSSLFDLYYAFVDSFPESEYARVVAQEYNIRSAKMPTRPRTDQRQQQQQPADTAQYAAIDTTGIGTDTADAALTDSRFIIGPDGDTLEQANKYFLREEIPFDYPLSALAYNIEDLLYFQIRINFSGEVEEVVLMNETRSQELNQLIVETVKNTKFDAGRIPAELYDHWFSYTYTVTIPSKMKQ